MTGMRVKEKSILLEPFFRWRCYDVPFYPYPEAKIPTRKQKSLPLILDLVKIMTSARLTLWGFYFAEIIITEKSRKNNIDVSMSLMKHFNIETSFAQVWN